MADANQIIVKPKNYDFYNKNRRVKTVVAADHPLRPNAILGKVKPGTKKFEVNTKSAKSGRGEDPLSDPLSSRGFVDPLSAGRPFVDPLSAGRASMPQKPSTTSKSYDDPFANPLEDPLMNPLSRKVKPAEPVSSKSVIDLSTKSSISDSSPVKSDAEKMDDEDDTAAQNLQELKTVKEQNLWTDEIKSTFLKTFKLKNLESLRVENPFKDAKALIAERQKTVKYVERGKGSNSIEQESETAKNAPHVQSITYSLYIKSIENIKRNVMRAWANNDKVLALQLTIQCVKLLMDTKESQFYPVKYVYIIDVLEIFTTLVFERVKGLSFPKMTNEQLKKLKETEIVEANINDAAKDICKNWFIKCSVIRELLPRVYIEIALLKNMVFINKSKIPSILMRLSKVIRGIANPLVAGYALVYLIRVGAELYPKEKEYVRSSLQDFFILMREGNRLGMKDMAHDEVFLNLYEPILENGFKYYARNCGENDFREMLKAYEENNQHAEILKKIIKFFGVEIVSENTLLLIKYIQTYQSQKKFELYTTLCEVLVKKLPPKNVIAVLFKDFLEGINEIKDFSVFLNFTAALLDFIAKCYDGTTKNQFLNSILVKFNDFFAIIDLTKATEQDEVFQKLQSFMENIIESCSDVNEILSLEPFLQFVTYLPNQMRVDVCKRILKLFAKSDTRITDPMVAHTFLSIARNLNDNYGFAISEDQKQEISELLIKFISNVDYGRDLEQTLNLYTDVRANFGNMTGIMQSLINYGLDLCMKCRKFSKGRVSKKVIGFIQAAISFCLISIVTIEDPLEQFDYYFRTTQIAMMFNLVSQAETLFKSAIALLTEIPNVLAPRDAEVVMVKKLRLLISYMVVIPEDPENDYLHIFNGLYSGIDMLKWDPKTGYYAELELRVDCLGYLCTECQEQLPYHVENVKSNDELYTESEYKEAMMNRINEVAADIHSRIKDLAAKNITDAAVAATAIRAFLYTINNLMTHLSVGGKCTTMIIDCLNAISSIKQFFRDRKEITLEKVRYLKNTCQAIEKYDKSKEMKEKLKLIISEYSLL